ncbi:MAG: undecaprenyl/decaprenyl-phosphate alpha-N-acetylglucosaminyl 1-phosphate transferase [Ruminococcaceae bacterium]|nr:undecaprenyl/decaprenyl-phosphate alpha-N-acetylglucosaminyl 1-phosphate transferase [Oscillospiraceae bacterium]
MNIYTLIFCFSLSFIISFASTPFVKKLAFKINAIDVPNSDRHIHKKPTPLIGGLAIFFGFIIGILLFFRPLDVQVRGILIAASIMVLAGIIDDTIVLKAKVKLLIQIVCALIVYFHGIRIMYISMPDFVIEGGILPLKWFSLPITVIWIVGVTNAVNLIDGLDGLAAGVSSIATFALFFIAILVGENDVAILTAALAGACLGFLPYNLNPARIFMGDTGALFLGFILSIVCIQGLFKGYALISFVVPFLILGLPLFDTFFAILRRLINKKPIMEADRSHLHHKLMDMGFSQKQTVAFLYVISILLAILAVVVVRNGAQQAIWFVIAILAAIAVSMFISMQNSSTNKKDDLAKTIKSENKSVNVIVNKIEVIDDENNGDKL